MKVKTAVLRNFGKFAEITVNFDENLTYLIGNNGAGKSSIGITVFWYVFQGIAEKASKGSQPLIGERFRFIGPNGSSATGTLILVDEKNNNAEITITRKITKGGNELSFKAPEGYPHELNQEWLNELFNLFLISPKRFTELTPVEQARALGIDTTEFDTALKSLKAEFTLLNRDLKQYDNVEFITPADKVDVNGILKQKAEVSDKIKNEFLNNRSINEKARKEYTRAYNEWENRKRDFDNARIVKARKAISANKLLDELIELGYAGDEVSNWISALDMELERMEFKEAAPQEPQLIEEVPDSSRLDEFDEKLAEAYRINEQAEKYTQFRNKMIAKDAIIRNIDENKTAQKQQEQKRVEYIRKFDFPFSNIAVNDEGEILMNGKPIKDPYFSTGELLKIIPILLSQQNPEFKYVFLQDFLLMDEEKQSDVIEYLLGKGFQLVIEKVGTKKEVGKNSILLKDMKIVDSYNAPKPLL